VPAGQVAADAPCAPLVGSADTFPVATACAAGLQCVVFAQGATSGICLPQTDACVSGACAPGRVCLALAAGKAVCALDCKSLNCPAQTECTTLASGDKVCGPASPTGSVGFGGLCGTPVQTLGCKAGLTCLTTSPTSLGYCSADCASSGVCPTYVNAEGVAIPAACSQISANPPSFQCTFPCGQPGQLCPDGLQCTPVGSLSLCLAP
jgi:hypothetical protein